MSQSASALSPSPSSHSQALFTTCDCSRPGTSSHWRRKLTHLSSDSLKKRWSEARSSGFAPESVEYGSMSCVGEYTELQFSHASPYWSLVPHTGHVPLM